MFIYEMFIGGMYYVGKTTQRKKPKVDAQRGRPIILRGTLKSKSFI